jgi:WD40 repeat protein
VTTAELAPEALPPPLPPNPYVGPRSFRYGEPLFGRSSELAEILDLVVAQRILLLYSPSGAGKTSLLEAGLRPALEANDFHVLPTARVSHEPPPAFEGIDIRNRYLLSALLSFEEGRPAELQMPRHELASIGLGDYLALWSDDKDHRDPCVIFDQFEELFTLDPTDLAAKAAFLGELGDALRDRGRWAVLSMREDFVAQLDPHLELFSTLLRTRYRLDLLSSTSARAAIQKPAELAGARFSDEAADRLVDDLRRVRVQRGSTVTEEPGPYVEPVQLQVVCRRLWSRLSTTDRSIELDDVVALGDVDNALADYYDEEVTHVASHAQVAERSIRTWFDEDLISTQGFRTQVLDGPGDERAAIVLAELEDAHLIRADRRRGAVWYELAHDRMIEPVRRSNAAWSEAHLSTLQREAHLWEAQGRPSGLLLTGDVLAEAEHWADEHKGWLVPVEHEFLEACREERRHAEVERRTARRTRRLAIAAAVVSVVAIAGLVAALFKWRDANHQRDRADQQALSAAWTYAAEDSFDEQLRELGWLYAFAALPQGEDANALLKRRVESVHHLLTTDPLYLATTADLSPDGERFVRGAEGGRVEVVEIADPPVDASDRTELTGEPDEVLDVEFGPDSDTIAVSSLDGDQPSLVLWKASDGQQLANLDLPDDMSVSGLVFSREPQVLAAIGRSSEHRGDEVGELLLWDMPSGQVVPVPDDFPPVRRIAVSRDGSTVAGVDADYEVAIFRRDGGRWTEQGARTPVQAGYSALVELSPDGSEVLVGADAGPPVLLPVVPAAEVETAAPQAGETVAFTADESATLLGATFLDDNRILLVDDSGNVDVSERSAVGQPFAPRNETNLYAYSEVPLEFSDDATRILALQPGYEAAVYSVEDGSTIVGHDTGLGSAIGPSNEPSFTVGDRTFTLPAKSPNALFAWAADPSGRYVFGGSSDGTVSVWDLAGRDPIATVDLGNKLIGGLVLSADHVAIVLYFGAGEELVVYPMADFVERGTLSAPELDLELFSGMFTEVTFTDDGEAVEITEQDGSTTTVPLHPDHAALTRDALALAEARGLTLTDEECRDLVHAACPRPPDSA